MTLAEYSLRMESFQLREVYYQEHMAVQAWFNQTVKATTGGKHPRPKYRKLNQFFDYQRAVDEVRSRYEPGYSSGTNRQKSEAEIFVERVKEFKKLKKEGRIIPWSKRKKGG